MDIFLLHLIFFVNFIFFVVDYGQELDVGTYGEDTGEEVDIHAGGVKWKKKGQSI